MFTHKSLSGTDVEKHLGRLEKDWFADPSRLVEIVGRGRINLKDDDDDDIGPISFKPIPGPYTPHVSTEFRTNGIRDDVERYRNSWKTPLLTHGSAIGGLHARIDHSIYYPSQLPGSSGFFTYAEGNRRPHQSLNMLTAGHVLYPPRFFGCSSQSCFRRYATQYCLRWASKEPTSKRNDVVGTAGKCLQISHGQRISGDAVILELEPHIRRQLMCPTRQAHGCTPGDSVFTICGYSASITNPSLAVGGTIPLSPPQVGLLLNTTSGRFGADRIEAILPGVSNVIALRTPSEVAKQFREIGKYFLGHCACWQQFG